MLKNTHHVIFSVQQYGVSLWKKIPLLRLLIAFVIGIIVQWNCPLPNAILWTLLPISTGILLVSLLLPVKQRYGLSWLFGCTASILFFSLGNFRLQCSDLRTANRGIANHYTGNEILCANILEPPVEKPRSLKCIANITLLSDMGTIKTKGKIIIYLRKDSNQPARYGQQLLFRKAIQPIKNTGNPGAFDYQRYCLSQSISHQVFLDSNEYILLPNKQTNRFDQFLFEARERIIQILRKNIPGEREAGLSEALLIGYKDELDPDLVQAYTNTGVVHVIAISGLHLGLIYSLLLLCCRPLKKNTRLKWLRLLIILSGLWLFSLLAGAQPSILRSAVMFTSLATGECLLRRSSMLNSLACSAFLLLCINPYWLWDAGFQLSYAAVLSIVLFMQPVYNWFYFKNKILDALWKLNAVTIAAQLLTIPICLYHFHQFPNYFLLTNIVAVPLSSVILVGEIILCAIAVVPQAANVMGQLLSAMIRVMNNYIEYIDHIPFAVWQGLYITTAQVYLLYIFIALASYSLQEKSKPAFKLCLIALLGFVILRSQSFRVAAQQHLLVVYNVPKKRAVDIFEGRKCLSYSDSSMANDKIQQRFHLQPCRTMHRAKAGSDATNVQHDLQRIIIGEKKIVIVNMSLPLQPVSEMYSPDLLILSKNAKLKLDQLQPTWRVQQVVFDGSASSYKVRRWKYECMTMNIPWHDVSTDGAFVMNLQ